MSTEFNALDIRHFHNKLERMRGGSLSSGPGVGTGNTNDAEYTSDSSSSP